MQVTKNEKIVKVVQEETYDIKGLTKAEAIALLFLVSNTNGRHTRSIYDELDEALEMDNQVGRPIVTGKLINGKVVTKKKKDN